MPIETCHNGLLTADAVLANERQDTGPSLAGSNSPIGKNTENLPPRLRGIIRNAAAESTHNKNQRIDSIVRAELLGALSENEVKVLLAIRTLADNASGITWARHAEIARLAGMKGERWIGKICGRLAEKGCLLTIFPGVGRGNPAVHQLAFVPEKVTVGRQVKAAEKGDAHDVALSQNKRRRAQHEKVTSDAVKGDVPTSPELSILELSTNITREGEGPAFVLEVYYKTWEQQYKQSCPRKPQDSTDAKLIWNQLAGDKAMVENYARNYLGSEKPYFAGHSIKKLAAELQEFARALPKKRLTGREIELRDNSHVVEEVKDALAGHRQLSEAKAA